MYTRVHTPGCHEESSKIASNAVVHVTVFTIIFLYVNNMPCRRQPSISDWPDARTRARNAVMLQDGKANADETYFVTFPYPYMNGKLHLGHTFTLTKVCV